jgi:hypothetical protein
MTYEERRDRLKEISVDAHRDLKPIFDRLIKTSDRYMDSKNNVDYTEYNPTCGITTRNKPMSEEQIRDADMHVDQSISEIIVNPDDFSEIDGQVPIWEKGEAGSGKGDSEGAVTLVPIEFPEWLEDLETEVEAYMSPSKIRKGLDYEEALKGVFRKARDRAQSPDNALFVFIDTSGSMWGYKDRNGTPLLKLFASYFPTIAEKYNGEVWFADYAEYNAPEPISRSMPLEDFRADSFMDKDKTPKVYIGGAGGTDFWGVWQVFDKEVRKVREDNPDAKIQMIFFSDMEADFKKYPELITDKQVIFVTVKGKGQEVQHLVDGTNIKLIYADATQKL